MRTDDNILRLQKPVYDRSYDTGGMFDGHSRIYEDKAEDCDLPFLALVVDGWNGGYGKRHASLKDAERDLERLEEKMFG